MSTEKPKIYIGTSGWCYNSWEGIFYPENLNRKEWLNYYSQYFNTVEINSSFYHLPKAETFKSWAKKTSDNFIFVVKASKYITHTKRLVGCYDAVLRLIDLASCLDKKLGMFLFQLPPSLKKDIERLEGFFNILPSCYNYVFEFREESWFCEETYELLKAKNLGIVISDSPSFPRHEVVTSNYCYIRMHGSSSLYASKYTDDELEEIAKIVIENYSNGISSYVYFNNDIHGYAVENAKFLKNLLNDFVSNLN